jgi:hypothetical protein
MNEIIEENKKQYSEEDIKTITSEVKDITALQICYNIFIY